MTEKNIISQRIKELRFNSGLKQKEFAKKISVSPASLSAYETTVKNPPIEVLCRIVKEFNVTLDWLCGLDNKIRKMGKFSEMIKAFVEIAEFETLDLEYVFEKGPHLRIYTCGELNYFFSEWIKIYKLYKNKTIDNSLYEAWVEKQLQEHNYKI